MKTITAIIILAIVTVTCSAIFYSCLANKTKPQVLFPPAVLAWPAVSEDYNRGLQDGLEDNALSPASAVLLTDEGISLGKALDTKDLAVVKTIPWATMSPWCERGIQDKIDDGEVSIGVAESLREQLSQFTRTITKLQQIP